MVGGVGEDDAETVRRRDAEIRTIGSTPQASVFPISTSVLAALEIRLKDED